MYYLFVLSVAVLFVLSFFVFDRDIMQPAVFLAMFFLAGALFAFYKYQYWQLFDFDSKTSEILILGLLSFVLGAFMARTPKTRRLVYGFGGWQQGNGPNAAAVDIHSIVLVLSVMFSLLTVLLFVSNFGKRVFSTNVFQMIIQYKESRTELESRMPAYLNIMFKTLCAFAHVQLFIFLHNSIQRRLAPKDCWLVLPAFVYAGLSVLGANRGNVLILLFNAFAAWYILYSRAKRKKRNLTWKFLRKSFAYALVFLFLFWGFMMVTRQKSTAKPMDSFLTYVCAYFSGPLASLNLYVKQGGCPCEWWGQETFVTLNNNLHTLLGLSVHSDRFLEFRSGFGYSVVNIYTSFRRFYHDFGMWGVALLSAIQGFFTAKLYYRSRLPIQNRLHFSNRVFTPSSDYPPHLVDFTLVFYCFFFYTIPYTLTDEFVYSSNVSISGLIKISILVAVYGFTMLHARRRA